MLRIMMNVWCEMIDARCEVNIKKIQKLIFNWKKNFYLKYPKSCKIEAMKEMMIKQVTNLFVAFLAVLDIP